MKMLLARRDIDINTRSEDGPFTVSVVKSHEQLLRLFLNRPDLVLATGFRERGVDPLRLPRAKLTSLGD